MESEDEVDIEGESDLNPDESPSKLVDLQPELSEHPWALEQGWSVDHCEDEKSRAVIEKMILEEQQYFGSLRREGTTSYTIEEKIDFPVNPLSAKPRPTKRPWTAEEEQLFIQGIEIFGRKWKKIADIIPGKSDEQVKHYGIKYFKKLKECSLEEVEKKSKPASKGRGKKKLGTDLTDDQLKHIQAKRNTSLEMFPEAQLVRLSKNNESDSEQVDIDVDVDVDDSSKNTLELQGQFQDINSKINTIKTQNLLSNMPDDCHISKQGNEIYSDFNEESELVNTVGAVNMSNEVLLLKSEIDIGKSCKAECISWNHLHNCEVNNKYLPKSDLVIPENLSMDGSIKSKNILTSSQKSESADLPHNNAESSKSHMLKKVQIETQGIPSTSDWNNLHCKKFKIEQESCVNDRNIMQGSSPDVNAQLNIGNTEWNSDVNEDQCDVESQNTEESTEDEHANEFPVQGSDGKIFYLQNPTETQSINPEEICSQEKEIFVEFFDGRPGLKYADKYKELRNCILDMWEKMKPNFLSKTTTRNGLKKCKCDVNLLSRIHSYLEQIGAINFGCEQVQYKNKKRARKSLNNKNSSDQLNKYNKEELSKRRRKVRDMFGMWVDEKEIEGRTIDHDRNVVCTEMVKPKKKPNNRGYDPFKLIACQNFGSSVPAPFELDLDIKVLMLMDIHAHLSKTEVIGLLGGLYDNEKAILQVLVAEPCESLSTGMQCEMDPVSQTEAKEKISAKGYKVVGWYHSHPTFEPNPSVRDIETQENFQNWFSMGKNPFIGVIVSPYCQYINTVQSLIRCLIISKHTNQCADIGLPFQFNYTVSHGGHIVEELVEKVQLLLTKNTHSINRVEMLCCFKQSFLLLTCLEKLCRSLRQYFDAAGSTKDRDLFLEKLNEMMKLCYIKESLASLQDT